MNKSPTELYVDDFDRLQEKEEALIEQRRERREITLDEPRFGFAVSSGGMRSAAFGLGVTRALHEKGVYDRLDYLSTVGGGGFTSTFINWLRRKDSELKLEDGELVPDAALSFVRQNANYMNPSRKREPDRNSEPDAQATDNAPAPRPATLDGVVLGQMLLSLTVCASLLVGLFFLLYIGDAFVNLQKPILLLFSRNDVWRFCVTQLNFACVAGLVVLAMGGLRVLRMLLGRVWRGAWEAAVPAPYGGSPYLSDTLLGSLWFLIGLVTGALTIAALCTLSDGVASWIAAVVLASASKSSFARCKAHWDAKAETSKRNGIWLLVPLVASALVFATLLGLLAFYLFMSGMRPVGDPPVLARAGGVMTLALLSIAAVWLLPKALRGGSRFLDQWPAKIDLHASYKRSLAFQEKSGDKLISALAWFVLGSIPWLEELAEHTVGSRSLHVHLSAGAFALTTVWLCVRVATSGRPVKRRRRRLERTLRSAILGWVLYALLVLAHGVTTSIMDSSLPHAALWLTGLGLLLGSLSDLNFAGAGRVFKNRLAETFLPDTDALARSRWLPALAASDFPLSELGKVEDRGPYQLLNASLITDGSERRKYGQRGSDNFVFSPLYCGSTATGWAPTQSWQRGRMTLIDALAISSAASAPGVGFDKHGADRSRLVSAALSIFNLRLYYCADNPNPRHAPPTPSRRRPNLLFPGIRNMLTASESETSRHVRISDGAHFEALGLYELLRRKVELIVVSDATEDPKLEFRALAKALERAREDLDVEIEFEGRVFGASSAPGLYAAVAAPSVQARGFAIGTIHYSKSAADERTDKKRRTPVSGTLIYVKPTLVDRLAVPVQSFASQHAEFPSMPCPDRLFDELQFSAYEQLGYQIGRQALVEGLARESEYLDSVPPPRYDSFIRQLKGHVSAAKAG